MRSSYDLEFDPLSVQFYCPDLEVNADGGDERRSPRVVTEPKKQT